MINDKMSKTQKFNDRSIFGSIKISPELKFLQQVVNNKIPNLSLDHTCFKKLVKIVIMETTVDDSNMPENKEANYQNSLNLIANEYSISRFHLLQILAALFKLYHLVNKSTAAKQEIVKNDMTEVLKLPIEYVNVFIGLIYGSKYVQLNCLAANISTSFNIEIINRLHFLIKRREIIQHSFIGKIPQHVSLKSMSWRIDVSISTSSLKRTLEPSIYLKFILSNGQIVSFQMSISSFHLLRFNVALVLKEMSDLLNKQIFKLDQNASL